MLKSKKKSEFPATKHHFLLPRINFAYHGEVNKKINQVRIFMNRKLRSNPMSSHTRPDEKNPGESSKLEGLSPGAIVNACGWLTVRLAGRFCFTRFNRLTPPSPPMPPPSAPPSSEPPAATFSSSQEIPAGLLAAATGEFIAPTSS